jgi:hypothetical protein
MQRRRVHTLLASAALGGAYVLEANPTVEQGQSYRAHMVWVAEVLKRMETIHPGMTRDALLTVFATEGGLSNGLRRTFVSRDVPTLRSMSNSKLSAGRTKMRTDE